MYLLGGGNILCLNLSNCVITINVSKFQIYMLLFKLLSKLYNDNSHNTCYL